MSSGPLRLRARVREHSAFAWRVLARHGVRERDLEDACQEVFLVVLQGLAGVRGPLVAAGPGSTAICRRVAANYRKRAHAQARDSWRSSSSEDAQRRRPREGEAFEALAQKQSLALLEGLLARLPPAQREVFVLYEVEELNMREVAEALDCSLDTAFSRLYAARRALDAALKRLRAKRRVA